MISTIKYSIHLLFLAQSPEEATVIFSEASLSVLNACLGFIMFGIALDLSIQDFKRLRKFPKASIVGVASQFVVLPFLTWLLVITLQPQAGLALGMILVAACPGGNTSNFMTHLSKGNAALSITLTTIATASAVLLTPLNFGFWSSLVPGLTGMAEGFSLSPGHMLGVIAVIILLPLFLGMATAASFPSFTAMIRKPVRVFSLLIFSLFIIIALVNNWHLFKTYGKEVFSLVIVHNLIALSAGYGLARVSNLGEYNARAIALETGLQNSGLGLVLIFNFFGGAGGMALIAACWGVWHLISGLILAFFWSNRPPKMDIDGLKD